MPGRTFTHRMYDKLALKDKQGHLLKQYHHMTLGKDFKQDCEVWVRFLSNPDINSICRPFVDVDAVTHATVLNFYSDVSLSGKKGLGAVFDNRFIVGKWGEHFIMEQQPSIEYLELFALFVALVTWGDCEQLCNTRVIIYCDNQSVRDMINGYHSCCSQCLKILRLIALDEIKFNRRVFMRYVKLAHNILADSLSRMDFQCFWKHAPISMRSCPDEIPTLIWPVEKVWFNEEL